jgi:uncharacterized protein
MELTKKERLSFIHQFRILEALYPEEAADFAKHRTALEDGYVLHYDWMFEQLDDELSEADCREVLEILDMFRAIHYGLADLDPNDALQKHGNAKFSGFDGNHEGKQMAYAHYFIVDLGRFSELKTSEYPGFNSHWPTLETYRSMLVVWKEISTPSRFKLSRGQLQTILVGTP